MIDVKFDQKTLINTIRTAAEERFVGIRLSKKEEIERLFEQNKESFSEIIIHIENTTTKETRNITFLLDPVISFNDDPNKIIASITFTDPEDSVMFFAQNEGSGLIETVGDEVLAAINTALKKGGKKEIVREKDVQIYLEPSKAFQKFITDIQVNVSGVKKSIG